MLANAPKVIFQSFISSHVDVGNGLEVTCICPHEIDPLTPIGRGPATHTWGRLSCPPTVAPEQRTCKKVRFGEIGFSS